MRQQVIENFVCNPPSIWNGGVAKSSYGGGTMGSTLLNHSWSFERSPYDQMMISASNKHKQIVFKN